MKISKLFHWLYAILMLLPVFAIGVTCAYVILNKNAYRSYYGDTINETSNEYLDIDEFEQNHTYYVQTSLLPADTGSLGSVTFNISYAKNLSNGFEYLNDTYNRLRFFKNDNKIYIQFMRIDGGSSITYTDPATIQFTYESINGPVGTIVDYLDFYEIVANPSTYLDNVFYYSIYELKDNSVFNWAYDSFLAIPITYVTALFGMPNDSIVILLLSYWLDISIIYLVFDLIIYVPLLVHRWLDKGVLE